MGAAVARGGDRIATACGLPHGAGVEAMSGEFNAGEARGRIGQLRAEITERLAEIAHLQDIIDGPRVEVLALYFRYGRHYTEECETIEDARAYLRSGDEDGYLVPEGISVNGELRPTDG